MSPKRPNDFAGRHLIVDASTYNRRNLTSTDTIFSLFEAIARNLDMTLVIPPIVCRYPFANNELEVFCDDIEEELLRMAKEAGEELRLRPIEVMKRYLKKRQAEDSGVTGISIWAESHSAIHTWDEDNYFSFDAFSCKDYDPSDAIRLLMTTFDVEVLNCVDLLRCKRSLPKITHFQIDDSWNVLIDGKIVGDLDSYDFDT
ncbi:MAG: S-adenosylmethionine decarboxylase [Deltaproteobacteria bacterium]|nr:S-adenosylmethionine decarboxylase [Deltaproteobacteria bacterium]